MTTISNASLKVFLVDDHPLYRSGTKAYIKTNSNHSVFEFATLNDSLSEMDTHMPDVVFLDMELPDGSGLRYAQKFINHLCSPWVFILTTHRDASYISHAKDIGVHGFLFKDDDPDSLIKCLTALSSEPDFFLSENAHETFFKNSKDKFNSEQHSLDALTKREREVLYLLACDMTSKEIAVNLGVSFRTIQNHRANIKSKLLLERNSQLLRLSVRWKSELEKMFR